MLMNPKALFVTYLNSPMNNISAIATIPERKTPYHLCEAPHVFENPIMRPQSKTENFTSVWTAVLIMTHDSRDDILSVQPPVPICEPEGEV